MATSQGLRILFVEDLPADATLAEREIRKSGIEFSSQRVDTKDGFLKALDEFRPDIIVSDYSMPEFDGMQALKLSLDHDPLTPFILLTGAVNEETAVACMKAGASDYVIKEHMTRLPFAVRDALEQKKVRVAGDEGERALRESEKKYRYLFANHPQPMWIYDLESLAFLEVNSAAIRHYGYTREEFLSMTLKDIRPKEDIPALLADVEHTSQTHSFSGDWRHLKKNGELIHVEINSLSVTFSGRDARHVMVNDITDRKKGEESRLLLTTAIESSTTGVVITDTKGSIVWVNRAFSDMTGYSQAEVQAQNPKFLKSGKQDDSYYTKLWQTISVGHVWAGEIINRRKDGSLYTEEMNITPVRTQKNEITHFVALKQDITERKRAEEALRTSESQLSSAMTMARLGHWEYDVASDLFTFNDQFYAMFRTTARQVGGYTMSSSQYAQRFVHPDDMPLVGIETRKALESNDPHYSVQVEHRIIYADGENGYITVRIFIVKDDQGRTIKTYGVNQDITERRRVEQALADSEKKFKWLFDYAPVAYHVLTPEGTISDVNVRWCETLGYDRSEVLGRAIYDFILPEELPDAKLSFEMKKKNILSIRARNERTYVAKDGTPRAFLVGDFVTTDSQGNLTSIQTTLEDITARKQSEGKLRLSEERFRSVWDNSADGMRLVDNEGHIIAVNEAYCRLVDLPREKLVGEMFSVAYARGGPDDDIRIYRDRFASKEIISKLQAAVTLWNGTVLELDISNSYIDTAGAESMVLSIFRDITERKQAAQRLEEERNLLRTIIQAIPDEVCVKDTVRKFVLVNPGTVKALGKSSEDEIIGKRDEDLIPEQFARASKEEEEEVLATGSPRINRLGKSRINALSGEIERSILISKIPLKDGSGKVVGLVGINRDVTELQRTNAALEKERTLLSALIESIPDEICLKDTAHRFVVANSAVARALGAGSAADLLGKTDFDFMRPELAQTHFDDEDAILASGHSIINLERTTRSQLTGETEKCLLTTKVPVRNKDGEKIGILVVNRHITERKKAEEALRASEEKFRALFEESKDVVYISTADGKLLDINAAGVQLFGYGSKEELMRIDLGRDSYADPIERERFRSEIARVGFVRDFELTLRTKSGDALTVLETATAVRDKLGKVLIHRGIIRDVTKQRLLERQFLQAQKMESIGTLAGGIAHDFNNILGIVLGHLALLERTRQDDAQFEESIYSITKAVDRGASLVRQILTFARKTDTQLEPVNINAMIRELAKMLEETFPKTTSVTLHLDKTIPATSLDPTQLHQALLNLCVNPRDAMNGQGTLTLATKLVAGEHVKRQFPEAGASFYMRVSVADTGTGMDDPTKRRIFEPFFTTKEKGKGTGLGLAVVYGVLQAHHGFIDVVSAKGSGTTFQLFFPIPEGILAPVTERAETQPDLQGGTETILVVEDEDILRDLLVRLLEIHGYRVIQASDGDEAVRRFNEHAGEIDLVLSDMGLPKRNGWEAITAMRGISATVRALLASGYLDPGQKSEVLKSGVRGFIQKPYKMEEVLKVVRETLDAKQ